MGENARGRDWCSENAFKRRDAEDAERTQREEGTEQTYLNHNKTRSSNGPSSAALRLGLRPQPRSVCLRFMSALTILRHGGAEAGQETGEATFGAVIADREVQSLLLADEDDKTFAAS